MSETKFEHGDLVQLRSGGMVMTFDRITAEGFAIVMWTASDGLHQSMIPPGMLMPSARQGVN